MWDTCMIVFFANLIATKIIKVTKKGADAPLRLKVQSWQVP